MECSIRKPKAKDLFVVSKIIKGVGLKNIVDCFNSEELKDFANKLQSENKTDFTDEQTMKAGAIIMMNVGELILDKLDVVKDDLIKFMSNLTEMSVNEIEDLPLYDFAEIFFKIIKEPDFADFIKVVLKSFN